jgi:hypothetical protein
MKLAHRICDGPFRVRAPRVPAAPPAPELIQIKNFASHAGFD